MDLLTLQQYFELTVLVYILKLHYLTLHVYLTDKYYITLIIHIKIIQNTKKIKFFNNSSYPENMCNSI